MRAPLAMGALLCAMGTAAVQAAAPQRGGYAFAYPRVLAQQRIFGLAHGIALLAAACRAAHPRAAEAYDAWHAKQQLTIAAARDDLGRYYFGDGGADERAIDEKMNLRPSLDGPLTAAELDATCTTLPEALARPRYDFVARFRLEEYMARVVVAAEVEVRHAHCREKLTGDERDVHEARHGLWHEINDKAAREAAAVLEREWPADAPAASYAEWVNSLKKEIQAHGDRAACLEFSASLKHADSFPRNVFRMPPPAGTK